MDAKARSEGGTKPGQQIVASAGEMKASLVVIGTRGMGKLRRTVMGSVRCVSARVCACDTVYRGVYVVIIGGLLLLYYVIILL